MSRHLAAYDISRNNSRSAVAAILARYGRRVQESLFEVDIDPDELAELKQAVGPWLATTDLFDLFPIDTRRPESRLSWQRDPSPAPVALY